ncbi:MAG: sulfatase family protein [Akkermansiaceae bacterium]
MYPTKKSWMMGSLSLLSVFCLSSLHAAKKPNIILIFADDLGYGDLGCYGADYTTPAIDKLADEGLRATDFFVPANVCGPSRAALLTGRYPMRCGHPISRLILPKYASYRLEPDEVSIPALLKTAGYHNLMVGKWHLGMEIKGSHPLDVGFDEYLGIPNNYSHKDQHSDTLYRGKEIEQLEVPGYELTQRYTDEVVSFIKAQTPAKGSAQTTAPFFIYVAQHIAHNSMFATKPREGLSKKASFIDFIQDLDRSTGRIIQAVKDAGLDENTIIVFTSDNGPALPGSAGLLSGGKYVTMEGGHRVPAIFRWTGEIPAGQVSDITVSSLDLLPLFCGLAGVDLPQDRKYDGTNILDVLRGEATESPHQFLYYYNGVNLQAVRKGKWKLHLPRTVADQPFWAKKAGGNNKKKLITLDQPMLIDLELDIGEKYNLADQYPEVVNMLQREARRIRAELGDNSLVGSDQRAMNLENPTIRE